MIDCIVGIGVNAIGWRECWYSVRANCKAGLVQNQEPYAW